VAKAGRPKLPLNKSRKQLIGVRVSIDELRQCQEKAGSEGLSLSSWARKRLLEALNHDT